MTTARDIMHTGAECIGEHQTLQHAARRMRASPADREWLREVLDEISQPFGCRIGREPDGALIMRPPADSAVAAVAAGRALRRNRAGHRLAPTRARRCTAC